MDIGLLIKFMATAALFLVMGFYIGVLVESKNLLKWFDKELNLIEERYKHKYDGDGEQHETIDGQKNGGGSET